LIIESNFPCFRSRSSTRVSSNPNRSRFRRRPGGDQFPPVRVLVLNPIFRRIFGAAPTNKPTKGASGDLFWIPNRLIGGVEWLPDSQGAWGGFLSCDRAPHFELRISNGRCGFFRCKMCITTTRHKSHRLERLSYQFKVEKIPIEVGDLSKGIRQLYKSCVLRQTRHLSLIPHPLLSIGIHRE
jgi:hypothetical protein